MMNFQNPQPVFNPNPVPLLMPAPPPSTPPNGTEPSKFAEKVDHTYRDYSRYPPTEEDRRLILRYTKIREKTLKEAAAAKQGEIPDDVELRNDTQVAKVAPDVHTSDDENDSEGINKEIFQGNNFAFMLHDILSRKEFSSIISWLEHGRAWIVLDKKRLMEILTSDPVISKHYKMTKYDSFKRQVTGWNFKRLTTGRSKDSEKPYYNELFLRGMPHLVKWMNRLSGGTRRKLLIDPENEPDLTKISEMYPLYDFFAEDGEGTDNKAKESNGEAATGKRKNSTDEKRKATTLSSNVSSNNGKKRKKEGSNGQPPSFRPPIQQPPNCIGSRPAQSQQMALPYGTAPPQLQQAPYGSGDLHNPHICHGLPPPSQPTASSTGSIMGPTHSMTPTTGGAPPMAPPPGYAPANGYAAVAPLLSPQQQQVVAMNGEIPAGCPVADCVATLPNNSEVLPAGPPQAIPQSSAVVVLPPSAATEASAQTKQIVTQAAQIRELQEQVQQLTNNAAAAQQQWQIQSLKKQVEILSQEQMNIGPTTSATSLVAGAGTAHPGHHHPQAISRQVNRNGVLPPTPMVTMPMPVLAGYDLNPLAVGAGGHTAASDTVPLPPQPVAPNAGNIATSQHLPTLPQAGSTGVVSPTTLLNARPVQVMSMPDMAPAQSTAAQPIREAVSVPDPRPMRDPIPLSQAAAPLVGTTTLPNTTVTTPASEVFYRAAVATANMANQYLNAAVRAEGMAGGATLSPGTGEGAALAPQ